MKCDPGKHKTKSAVIDFSDFVEKTKIRNMELHKICRICLKSDLLVSIYSHSIAFLLRPVEMIEKLNIFKVERKNVFMKQMRRSIELEFQLQIDDNLPKFLCQSCLYRLLDAYNLQELANASERQLRQYIGSDDPMCTNINQSLMQIATFPLKKSTTERAHFTSFYEMFQDANDIPQTEEDVCDDMLNDVEIDVSRCSEAEDTLSGVFVDAQINCHYETETRGFSDSIGGNNAEAFGNVNKSSSSTGSEATESITLCNGKRKVGKVAERCQECGKTFSTPGYLAQHKRIHTGEKPFKCKLCPRRFVQINNLRLHQRVHSGERRFQCEICASFFTTSSNLKAHIQTHKEARDYQCEQCEKRFKSIRELRRHQPLHNTIKENKCNMCQKAFSKRSYLNAHMLTVHRNVKKHKCKDCCKVFASKSNLKCHMRIHSGEKPFQCEYCVWKFNQSSALIRHIQKRHSNSYSKNIDKSTIISAQNVFEKKQCVRSTETKSLEFHMPVAPATIYSSSPTILASNIALEPLNSMCNSSITAINYEYNKLGQSLYTPSS